MRASNAGQIGHHPNRLFGDPCDGAVILFVGKNNQPLPLRCGRHQKIDRPGRTMLPLSCEHLLNLRSPLISSLPMGTQPNSARKSRIFSMRSGADRAEYKNSSSTTGQVTISRISLFDILDIGLGSSAQTRRIGCVG